MAADLYIHVFEGVTENDLAVFFAPAMGSKHFNPCNRNPQEWIETRDKVVKTPSVWVGEVSWLKAMIFESPEEFVPNTVAAVNEAIGEDLPVLDDVLLEKIVTAFKSENTTGYLLADPEEVRKFLEVHKGKRLFTVSS